MRIKKIQLKNGYKRFHDLTIDLGPNPKRIVALVGPNGCGKSSVLDGMLKLNSFYAAIGDTLVSRDESYHSSKRNRSVESVDIVIEFVEGPFDEVFRKKSPDFHDNTVFSFRSPYRYNSNLKIRELKAVDEVKLNRLGAGTTAEIDAKMNDNYRRLFILFNRFLKDNPEKETYHSAMRKIVGDLNSSLSNCLDLEISSFGTIEDNTGTLWFKKSDHDEEFEFNVLSAGEKEVVDILIDLYVRKNDFNDTIFLLDEPELHLNTAIQRKLLHEINRLIGLKCQIWITTHSIGFLRALQEDFNADSQIIHFEPGTRWASETQILVPVEMNRSKWMEIFSTALDDLTELVSPKRIVYCEGIGEPAKGGKERGFDAKVFNRIFSSQYPDTLFVSSGGNTELDQRSDIGIAILSKVFVNVEILVLKDRDSGSGRYIDDASRESYLENNPDYHRMLGRWELENYLFDKEVLKEYCLLKHDNGYQFDEEAYDEYVKNISNQNVKDNDNHFRNFCGIIHSINKEVFKLNLAEVIKPTMKVYKELEKVIFLKRNH